jgi:hypothetical protein
MATKKFDTSFNFAANVSSSKSEGSKKGGKAKGKKKAGNSRSWWSSYTGSKHR